MHPGKVFGCASAVACDEVLGAIRTGVAEESGDGEGLDNVVTRHCD